MYMYINVLNPTHANVYCTYVNKYVSIIVQLCISNHYVHDIFTCMYTQ